MPLEDRPNVKPDVERRLIGYLLADMDRMAELSTRVELGYFALPETQAIYEAAEDLWLEGSLEWDALETYLDEEGEIRAIGGADRLDELARKADTDAEFGLDYYCGLLKRAHKLRQVMDLAQRLAKVSTSQTGVERRWKEAEGIITDLLDPLARDSETVYTTEELRTIGRRRYNSDEDQVMPTGFLTLDKEIGGEPIGRVNVDAASTGMGKTSYNIAKAIRVARRLKEQDEGQVLFVSCELSEYEMERRMSSAISGVPADEIKKRDLTEKQLLKYMEAQDQLAELPITVDTHTAPTTRYLRGRVQAESAVEPIKLLIFDYLTYTGEEAEMEPLRLKKALTGLHGIAQDFSCAVTVVKQISREGSRRQGAPHIHDMQWSSAVEQIAGMVKVLYSPWIAAKQQNEGGEVQYDPKRYEVHVRKHTDGAVGPVQLRFDRRTMSFSDPEEESYRGSNGQSQEPLADEPMPF